MYQEPDWKDFAFDDSVALEGLADDFNGMMKQREAPRRMEGHDFTLTAKWDDEDNKVDVWIGDPDAGALRDEVFSGEELGAYLKGVLAAHDSPKGMPEAKELMAGMRPDDEDQARAFDAGVEASFSAAAGFPKAKDSA